MNNDVLILNPPHMHIAIHKDHIAGIRADDVDGYVEITLTSGVGYSIDDEDPSELFEQILKEIWP